MGADLLMHGGGGGGGGGGFVWLCVWVCETVSRLEGGRRFELGREIHAPGCDCEGRSMVDYGRGGGGQYMG